jgi:hypothetical protein
LSNNERIIPGEKTADAKLSGYNINNSINNRYHKERSNNRYNNDNRYNLQKNIALYALQKLQKYHCNTYPAYLFII